MIKFNTGNELAIDLFSKNLINFAQIINIIEKSLLINVDFKINNIQNILIYKKILINKIKSKYFEIDKICKEFNVPIAAAALQFCNANDLISTMILGMDRSTQVSQNIDFLNIKIAKEFWDKLKNNNLIDERSPTPN